MKTINTCRYYFFLLSISIVCLTNNAFAQSYLTATAGSITTSTVNHCQNFECSFTIKNTGTALAPSSIAYIKIANNTSFISPQIVAGSAVKSLTIGDSTTLSYAFSIRSYLAPGTYYVYIDFGTHQNYIDSPFTVTASTNHSVKIPYPIIFIHGLNSSDVMWNDFTNDLNDTYGFQSGGKMDFCLNYDGYNSSSNLSSDYHDFNLPLTVGDYYTINFAVNPMGNYDTAIGSTEPSYLSNQSAIFKQGRAVRDAIKHVRQITGKDKVILVGHSMGGLASREYLENPAIWQADGYNHVAKLFTIGTPHGGSNADFTGIAALAGVDNRSEAVRDLRYPDLLIFYYGRYLDGGTESSLASISYNEDINCNGSIGDVITGLNEKYLPSNISYSCTIGTGSVLGGDGVVASDRASINNYPGTPYLPYAADTLIDNQPGTTASDYQTHTLLPRNFEINMRGMDEDNYYNNDFPYHIDLNNSYYGFIQEQSQGSSTTRDYDNYTFTCTQKGTLNMEIENIIAPDFNLLLADSGSSTALSTFPISSNQNGNIDVQIQLPKGKYVLQTDAEPITNGFYYPYLLKTTFTPNWTITSYTLCAGSSQILTAPAGFSAYQWSLNGAIIPGATSQSISAGTAGYYSFQTTNSYGYIGPWSDSVHVTVNPMPSVISGTSTLCAGRTTLLTDATSGGVWNSSNSSIATIGAGGVVTGLAAGTTTITYDRLGCIATRIITVKQSPEAMTGTFHVCKGLETTLHDATPGGTWSSSNTSIATISAGGIATGIGTGTATITYTALGCIATNTITVNPPCSSAVTTINSEPVEIYPNPTNSELTIKINAGEYSSFVITNDIGQVVIKSQITAEKTIVNVTLLLPGVYSISLNGADGAVMRKFVKM